MKRVLIVYHHFAQYRLPVLRKLMQQTGYEYTLLSASYPQDGNRGIDPELAKLPVDAGGLKWEFLENIWIGGRKSPFLWQKRLLRNIKENDYDTVIFLGSVYYVSTWLAIQSAKRRGMRVILWTHGILGKDPKWLEMLRHCFYRSADACLLYGNRARELMLQTSKYQEEQLYVVYNSLDYEAQLQQREDSTHVVKQEVKAELFGDSEVAVVGYIGRIEPRKSLGLLIDAWLKAKENGAHFKIVIIGDGSDFETIRQRVQACAGERDILLLGYRGGEEASRLLGACDLCVVPGAVGLTAIHAMTMGVPVITNDDLNNQGPECEAIVEGQTGALFEKDSSSSLAKVTGGLLGDQALLSRMKVNCFCIIDELYNPHYQVKVINDAVDGIPASSEAMYPSNLF